MDYGLIRGFDKIQAASLPCVTQERGLFLVQLQFSNDAATRSVAVIFKTERSRYGEISQLALTGAVTLLNARVLPRMMDQLVKMSPPVKFCMDQGVARWTFIDQSPAREMDLPGALIFTASGELATILAQLH